MATSFLSKVTKGIQQSSTSDAGPGGYASSSTMKVDKPGFAPFSSTAKRSGGLKSQEKSPAPSAYMLPDDMLKKQHIGGTFKSCTKRFSDLPMNPDPGPGDYQLPSTFNVAKPKQFSRPADSYKDVNALLSASSVAPSIPVRHQSHGYDVTASGQLELQNPAKLGFTGRGADSVGPLEYAPNVDLKFANVPKALMKGSERGSLDKMSAKHNEVPGPGYYNTTSDFDLATGGGDNTNFLLRLNAARKRQNASFESKTDRNAMLRDIVKKSMEPGPGTYTLPSSINVKTVPIERQCLGTSGSRFKDNTSRSNRTHTAPGAYNTISSDFDKLRLKILKQKKMVSRSNWAQNIAFSSTESRIAESQYDNDVPAASKYYPKTDTIGDLKPRNPRYKAFGGTDTRFKEVKVDSAQTREYMAAEDLNRDIQPFLAVHNNKSGSRLNEKQYYSSRRDNLSPQRPAHSSVFGPSTEDRFRPVRTPPGPAPGSYDTSLSWKLKGSVVLAPKVGQSRKKHDPLPGPGDYEVSVPMGVNLHNRKNIMLSTEGRTDWSKSSRKEAGPGPGYYNLAGDVTKKSFNILLSDDYY